MKSLHVKVFKNIYNTMLLKGGKTPGRYEGGENPLLRFSRGQPSNLGTFPSTQLLRPFLNLISLVSFLSIGGNLFQRMDPLKTKEFLYNPSCVFFTMMCPLWLSLLNTTAKSSGSCAFLTLYTVMSVW